ncbi:MAG: hypothetical protein M1822_000481 [Bathelium mastoideum]|nr:MAG: hypothetical protein M1822_000481 [Bathelium mastoideum]
MSATASASAAAISKALASQLAEAKAHCTTPAFFQEAEPIYNGWTFHKILIASAGLCTLCSMVLSFGLASLHLANYVNPSEQKQFVRIIITPAVFAIFNFFAVWWYDAAPYLEQFSDYYEIFALVAAFYLCLVYVAPEENQRETFFQELDRVDPRKKSKLHDRGSIRWFYVSPLPLYATTANSHCLQVVWYMVFQGLVTRFFTTIATWVDTAVICPLNEGSIIAKVITSVIESFSTTLVLMGIIAFYRRLQPILKPHSVVAKLTTFKAIVAIQVIQEVVFPALQEGGVFKPAKTVAYDDWTVGLPAFLTCCEMFIFSILFIYPFRVAPYLPPKGADGISPPSLSVANSKYQHRYGFFRALLDVLNLWDILSGIWFHYTVVPYIFRKEYTAAGLPAAGGLKVIDSDTSAQTREWNQESQTAQNLRIAQESRWGQERK